MSEEVPSDVRERTVAANPTFSGTVIDRYFGASGGA